MIKQILLGAIAGWFTNKIAIYMLFHPVKKRRFLFFSLQGLIPKKLNYIATSIYMGLHDAKLASGWTRSTGLEAFLPGAGRYADNIIANEAYNKVSRLDLNEFADQAKSLLDTELISLELYGLLLGGLLGLVFYLI